MDLQNIRQQFPILDTDLTQGEFERRLIYFDHAASTHAPQPILDTYLDVQTKKYANVHRGEHELSCLSTDLFEEVPEKIARFIGVSDLENNNDQIVLTTNTTSSLDLASHLFANQDGKILTTVLEHHSNDLPHRRRGEVLHAGIDTSGQLDMVDIENKLNNNNVKLLAVSAGSNVTGYTPPIHKLARMAHDNDAKILIDAAQRLAHKKLDVKPKDHPEHIDFVAGAGHKTYAPFGAAFLYGDTKIFNEAEPYVPGGGTVVLVEDDAAYYAEGVDRHQFGTPNIAGSVALGAAIDFLNQIGIEKIRKHELDLLKPLMKKLQDYEDINVLGDIPLDKKLGVATFNVEGLHHSEVSHQLDYRAGIATRNGCFCAHPYIMRLLDITDEEMRAFKERTLNGNFENRPGAVRASLGIYNTKEEIDVLLNTLENYVIPNAKEGKKIKTS